MYLYGFGQSPWPTLEEAASEFNLNTRERARQIKQKFVQRYRSSPMLALQSIIGVLREREYWLQSDLANRLQELELVEHRFSISGLLDLASDVVAKTRYRIFTPDLEAASKNSISKFRDCFVIADSEVVNIRLLHKKLKGLPGRYGVAKLSYLTEDKDVLKYASSGLPEELIMLSEKSWSIHDHDDLWFAFEDRDNVLINYSEKVFSVIDECSPEELARSYRNALNGRRDLRYIHDYPSEEVIRAYLMNSRMLNYDGRVLRYVGENRTPPTSIEKELVGLLRDNPNGLRFPQIRDYLVSAGHSKPNINKKTFSSPLVSIDKTLGRANYIFTLVGTISATSQETVTDGRYWRFVRRLRNLESTDETIETKRRLEQPILREWLFEDNKTALCAICHKEYNVSSLVTAHKKKRSDCSYTERTEPNIVVPLCRFGCDFLYETRHVLVEEGTVRRGTPLQHQVAENGYLEQVVGNKVDNQWLAGPKFDSWN